MVLQKAPKSALIWGYADHTEDEVTVRVGAQGLPLRAKVYHDDAIGKVVWKTNLPPSEGIISNKSDLFTLRCHHCALATLGNTHFHLLKKIGHIFFLFLVLQYNDGTNNFIIMITFFYKNPIELVNSLNAILSNLQM